MSLKPCTKKSKKEISRCFIQKSREIHTGEIFIGIGKSTKYIRCEERRNFIENIISLYNKIPKMP